MTEAPERIWMDPDIKFPECEKQYGCDVEYIRADHVDALLKQAREDALREAEKNLRVYAPTLVDGPEHDVGYYHGYATAVNRILDMIQKDEPPKAKKPNLVGTGVQVGLLKKNPAG